jgi:hypothetical protein
MTNPTDSLISNTIREMTKLEFAKMLREAKEKEPKLDKDLEDLRQKLIPAMLELEDNGQSQAERRPEKRVQIETVSKILDVPVNELVLHFLNNVRTKNERSLVEYRLGHVYFYAG